MNTISIPPIIKSRKPKVASRLSDLAYGLGQIYCGHLVRGLVLYVIGVMVLAAWSILIALMRGRFVEALLIGLVPAMALWLFAKFDARRLAAKAPTDYVLKEYNRWYVYAMLVAIVMPVGVCGAFFISEAAYQAFQAVTDRMAPTVQNGQRVLVNKTVYDVEPMQRGDVVIVRLPDSLKTKLMQRLVALPGDVVELCGNDIVVNGAAIARPSAAPATQPATHLAGKTIQHTMPRGHGYFINDNPDAELNHRHLGDLGEAPLTNVVGRVEFIYWPRPAWVK